MKLSVQPYKSKRATFISTPMPPACPLIFASTACFPARSALSTRLSVTVVSRIKVMADLDIAEHRIPQDGRFRLSLPPGRHRLPRFRFPGVHGEDIVIRILDKAHFDGERKSLLSRGWASRRSDHAMLARVARAPAGMLLVTGPTGSGKTTTLYACLSEFSSGEEKVITIEDPVEYELPGVLQIPVAEKKGADIRPGSALDPAARPRQDHGRAKSATRKRRQSLCRRR